MSARGGEPVARPAPQFGSALGPIDATASAREHPRTVFNKVLIANRGEIACRVLRTCRRLGLATVAVYSDADENAEHVKVADEAVRLGPPPVQQSYLDEAAIVRAIQETRSDAVHPGYGLLSENRSFAEAVQAAGARFVGPPVEALEAFGDKIKAREVARAVGVEPPPGSDGPIDVDDEPALVRVAESVGFPVLVKAAGGGGGIGMQIVKKAEKVAAAARSCSDRGRSAFNDPRVYIERYLSGPRHIEVQVIADSHGSVVALGERECSVQRRHQKIIEETPSPASFFEGDAGEERRRKLHASAVRILEHIGYVGAGTVEFVADESGELFFLEVNARLQVEHPVTEMVTGLDLVELQLAVAAGQSLPASVSSAPRKGHSIEARVYAEDPSKKFVPQPGTLEKLAWPAEREGVRIDSGVVQGNVVTPYYDPMIAKVISHGSSRQEAIDRLDRALEETQLELVGPKGPQATNVEFLRQVLRHRSFVAGQYDTGLAEAMAKGKA